MSEDIYIAEAPSILVLQNVHKNLNSQYHFGGITDHFLGQVWAMFTIYEG